MHFTVLDKTNVNSIANLSTLLGASGFVGCEVVTSGDAITGRAYKT